MVTACARVVEERCCRCCVALLKGSVLWRESSTRWPPSHLEVFVRWPTGRRMTELAAHLAGELPVLSNCGGVAFDLSSGNNIDFDPTSSVEAASTALEVQALAVGADEDRKDAVEAARSAYAAFGDATALANSAPDEHYATVRDAQLLEVRTRQLKQLQQDYLRLHEHTLEAAQWYAEQQAAQQQQVAATEAARDRMKELLNEARGRAHTTRPALGAALQACEKMLARLAAVRSIDQLPQEMAAASAMLFETRTNLLRAESHLRDPDGAADPASIVATDGGGGGGGGRKGGSGAAGLGGVGTKGGKNAALAEGARRRVNAAFNAADRGVDPRVDRADFTNFAAGLGEDLDASLELRELQGPPPPAAGAPKRGAAAKRAVGAGAAAAKSTRSGAQSAAAASGATRLPKIGPSRGVSSRGASAGGGSRVASASGGKKAGPPSAKGALSGAAASVGGGDAVGGFDPANGYAAAPPLQPGPLPTGAAYNAASAFPAFLQQQHPAYQAAYAQQYQQAQQAALQGLLYQQMNQMPPGYGMGLPVWQQHPQ